MFILFSRILKAGHRRHVGFLLGAVVVFVFLGAWAFSATQHITFTSGLYWALTTSTTVGYGDITPKNPSGRLIASAVMLTCIPMLGAAFALATGAAASSALRRVLNMGSFPPGSYRLVLGSHPAVPSIIEELAKADDEVVLVADVDPVKVREDVHVVRGDPTEAAVLRKARPSGAVHCLITGNNDGEVLVSAVLLRKEAPDLPLSALVDSPTVRDALRDIGVTQTVAVNDLVAHTMAKSLETPHAGDLFLRLVDSEKHRLVELDADAAMVGRTLSEVRSNRGGLVLGLVRGEGFTLGIGEDPTVAAGDRVLVAEPSG